MSAAPPPRVFALSAFGTLGSVAEMGFKAHSLARMARLGLPVPQGFALGTSVCRAYLADPKPAAAALRGELDAALRELERASGLRFGDSRRPLLVSVRSGAAVSMPGMMDTLLNVGLNRATLRGLLRMTGNPRLVWDSYRRLIQSFAETVHGVAPGPFQREVERALAREGLAHPRELDFRALGALAEAFLALYDELTGERFPQDPGAQLDAAIAAVFRSWNSRRAKAYRRLHHLSEDLGTAVTVQRMVFGNSGGTSGTGVAFTRDPSGGENRLYADFLFNAQGEDVVGGRYRAEDSALFAQILPEAFRGLAAARISLEREFRDTQELEFTVQEGRLFLLQTRSAKRTPWAALRIAVEMVREGLLAPSEALAQLTGLDLETIVRARLETGADEAVLADATPASIGVAIGRLALDEAAVRRIAGAGQQPILVREELSTEDVAAIAAAAGVLSARGSRTAHAAVVARQMGKVCLVGCSALTIDPAARVLRIGERELREGDWVTLDANGGQVLAGEARVVLERPTEWLQEVARWRATEGAAAAPARV